MTTRRANFLRNQARGRSGDTTLFFVRHGSVREAEERPNIVYGHDAQLSPRGILQSRHIGRAIYATNIPIKHIFTSPYERTIDTTMLASAGLELAMGSETYILPGLADIDTTNFAGGLLDEVEDFYDSPRSTESHPDFTSRVAEVVDEIVGMARGEAALVVTHRDVIAAARFRLEHFEEQNIPSVATLEAEYGAVEPGEAVRIVLDGSCHWRTTTLLRSHEGALPRGPEDRG